MTEAQDLHRAAQAQEALENPLIAEALAAWETEITEAWKKSPLRDVEGRERLRLMLEAAQSFKAHLNTVIATGKMIRAKTRSPSMWERTRATLSGG